MKLTPWQKPARKKGAIQKSDYFVNQGHVGKDYQKQNYFMLLDFFRLSPSESSEEIFYF